MSLVPVPDDRTRISAYVWQDGTTLADLPSLFAVIIHDFPAGLSESEKPSASVFLHDPDQCLRLILAGRLLSHPGTNVVDSGEIMTNVHAPGIVPEIFRLECSCIRASCR